MQYDAQIFAAIVSRQHADLGAHFDTLGVHPLMYVTPWFMCVFTSLPCWDTVLGLWDLLFFRGVKVLHRAGLAVLAQCKTDLLSADSLGMLLPYLQRLPAPKVRRQGIMSALYAVDDAQLDVLLAHAELVVTKRQQEEETAASIVAARKRSRVASLAGEGAEAPSTPVAGGSKKQKGKNGPDSFVISYHPSHIFF